jgi:hypothetical protein
LLPVDFLEKEISAMLIFKVFLFDLGRVSYKSFYFFLILIRIVTLGLNGGMLGLKTVVGRKIDYRLVMVKNMNM